MRVTVLTTVKQRVIGDDPRPINAAAGAARAVSRGFTADGAPVAIWRIPAAAQIEIAEAAALELLRLGLATTVQA